MKHKDSTRRRRAKLLLIVGFLALTIAIVRAHFAPAQGYELSIYGATPITVWLGIGVALVAAVAVTALRPRGWLVPTALGLAVFATALLVFMPTVRGYYAYGQADALTHLGWARSIIAGEMEAMELFYPGGHSAVGVIHAVSGVTIPEAMMLFVQLLALGFLVFIPLTVRRLIDDLAGTAIAVFAACLLTPVTNISTFLDFHPYTMTTFFFAVVLFLLFEYLGRRSRGLANGFTATGFLLFLSAVAAVVIHGQAALNILILFGTIAAVQKFYRWLPGGSVFAEARSLFVPTAMFAGFYALWALRYEIVYTMFGRVYNSVEGYLFASQGQFGEAVGSRTANASDAGISLIEIFMKLFFVRAVFVALAAILVLVALAGRLEDDTGAEDRNEAITYFAYGGLVLGPFFLAHFLGSVSRYFFRHVGFGMVIATILGVVMLHSFYRAVSNDKYERTVRAVAAIAVLGGLLLSLLVVFPSPYISLTTNGVSEQMVDGYDTGFQYDNDDARWTSLRSNSHRYEDALNADVLNYDSPSNQNFTDRELTSYAGRPYYLALTQFDYEKEVIAYDGARYNASGFEAVEQSSGVSRVMSNGEFTLYFVDSENPPEPDDGGDAGGNDTADEGANDDGDDPPPTEEPESTPIPEVTPDPTPEPTTAPDGGDTAGNTTDGADGGADGDTNTGDGSAGGGGDGANPNDGTADEGGDGANTGDGDAGGSDGGANAGDGGANDAGTADDGANDAGTGGGGGAGTGGGGTGGNQTGGNTTGSLGVPVLGPRSVA